MLIESGRGLLFDATLQKVSLFQKVNRHVPVSGPAFAAEWP